MISKHIQVYPFVSNIDIRIRYPWCYPNMLSCCIRLYPWYLSCCPFRSVRLIVFFWLQRLANILKYPFISFHPTEGKNITYFWSRTQYLVHTDQWVEPLRHDSRYQALLFVGICYRRRRRNRCPAAAPPTTGSRSPGAEAAGARVRPGSLPVSCRASTGPVVQGRTGPDMLLSPHVRIYPHLFP